MTVSPSPCPPQATALLETPSFMQLSSTELLDPRHPALYWEHSKNTVNGVLVLSNTTQQLMTDRWIPNTIPRALCALFHLISAPGLKVTQDYSHFPSKKVEAQRGQIIAHSNTTRKPTQVCPTQRTLSTPPTLLRFLL